MISTQAQLETAALDYGLLPFFANHIPEFSVEEMAAPGMLFGETPDDYGCWEWKGPVIRKQTTAYGKFFRRKAGFVARQLLPDFINYRRAAYPILSGSPEEQIISLFRQHDCLTSTELKRQMPGQKIETPLQRLQMGLWLIIADFEYKISAAGQRYGWGVALYTTPEIWFGNEITVCQRQPMESFRCLCTSLSQCLPDIPLQTIEKLLR
ncbi:MAG: hypothetical protein K2H33_00310 [Muribaculaceae bacterium]|nr:hypothetical protein [Muribaculaceae bacterium]